jgi:hypothetical protein
MKERKNRPHYNQEFKTFNSEQSCIDVFSKVESLFLEKFFRYNLTDYISDTFAHLEEDLLCRKVQHRQLKQLSSQSFLLKRSITPSELEQRLNNLYTAKGKMNNNEDFSFAIKLLFSNLPPT